MIRPRIARAFRLAVRRRALTAADVDAELQFHLEMRVEQLIAAGWTRDAAEREARRRFGPSWDDAVRTLHRTGQAREERLAMRERLDAVGKDLRYAARALARTPRFALSVVLTLALGLSAAVVVFSLVDHVVLRPLPYAASERLAVLRVTAGEMTRAFPTMPANARRFLAWREGCSACEAVAALRPGGDTFVGRGDPQRVGVVRASANLFATLGAHPALGRGFVAADDRAGGEAVAVVSDAFWRRELGGDPAAIGRAITLSDAPVTVVGVMPPDFALPVGRQLGDMINLPRAVDVYRPLALTPREASTPGEYDYAVVARLRPGATPARVRAQLAAAEASLPATGADPTSTPVVVPLQAQVVGGAGRPLALLLGAVGAVLLMVCANLASLMLARHAGREREAAVRVALGAGRARLASLALAECLVLAGLGGALAIALSAWGLRVLVALAPASLPRLDSVRLDGRVLLVAGALTLLVATAVGLLPALRLGRADPAAALQGARTTTGGRVAARRRGLFIGVQVALSTTLLVGAGLFLASFVRVLGADRGFDAERALAMTVVLPRTGYADADARTRFHDLALQQLSAIPGVTAAALATGLPLEGETGVDEIARPDARSGEPARASANVRYVSPAYFGAAGTPLRRGRAFADVDRGRPVVVVSARAAALLWPGEDAIGRRVQPGSNDSEAEVIGVADDVRTSSLEAEGSPVVYLPHWNVGLRGGTLLLRTTGDPAALTEPARAVLRRLDPGVAVSRVRTLREVVSIALAARRFQLALLALFAGMAVLAAGVGIYGIVAQSLAQRTREIGVRRSLGARAGDVHRLVLREGMRPVAIGLAVGLVVAYAAGRAAAGLLFGVRAGDPLVSLAVALLLGVVAAVACLVPARRATSTDLALLMRPD